MPCAVIARLCATKVSHLNLHSTVLDYRQYQTDSVEKDEINVPIALSAFRDGDQGPSKVTIALPALEGP